MKKIIILSCLTVLLFGSIAYAEDKGGLVPAGEGSGLNKTAISEAGTIPLAIGLFLNQALLYLGIIFFLLVVYAGLLWMSASGNDSKVEKAKDVLISAVVGLIIVVSAYAIVNFVFGNVLTLQSDECNNQGGTCIPVEDEKECKGTLKNNLCPGTGDFKCCVPNLP